MHEQSRNPAEFSTEIVRITLTDDERVQINDYIRELIDSYNGAETLASIESADPSQRQVIWKEGFETKHEVYIVKGSVVGWFDGEELEISDVRYPEQEGQDKPELNLGVVDTTTGKLVVTFQGLHFSPAHDQPEAVHDDGFYKTYGFIYDPSETPEEYRCLVSTDSDLATADRMVGVLSEILLENTSV